ncbi:MAG: branched-chain amino acid transport system substrate-binding protein [Kiritimatiellia bacterium]|jgi:branched-chain amino acid transport system substrate-binding protein
MMILAGVRKTIAIFSLMGLSNYSIAEDINIGMSTALSGPAKALGTGMKIGVESYFKSVNGAGGVGGKTLRLIVLDDGYEPNRAAPNMRKLIDAEKVVAVMGNVGTPTAIVTVPIANEKKVLLFGAFTGAGVLRKDPAERYVINYRASYAEETADMITGLLSAGIKPEEIAFFTQNDGYGDAGYQGAISALKVAGFSNVQTLVHGRYTRNTLNIEDGLATILDSDIEPRAIIMVGAYGPCAKFIKLAKEEFPDTHYLNVSFVGSNALALELGDSGEGVIVTQVVPHFNDNLALVDEYKKALAQFDNSAKPSFVSLEGYIVAKVFVEGLKGAGNINRESIIDGLESLKNLDIGMGFSLSYSKKNHQASHKIWPTRIKSGEYVAFEWSDFKR